MRTEALLYRQIMQIKIFGKGKKTFRYSAMALVKKKLTFKKANHNENVGICKGPIALYTNMRV